MAAAFLRDLGSHLEDDFGGYYVLGCQETAGGVSEETVVTERAREETGRQSQVGTGEEPFIAHWKALSSGVWQKT